jgi:hypothetical protein
VPAGIEPFGSHGHAVSALGETVLAVRDAVAKATTVVPANPIAMMRNNSLRMRRHLLIGHGDTSPVPV